MSSKTEKDTSRWMILGVATVSMMLIGLYQYSWSLLVEPLRATFGWSLEDIQLTFSIFVWIMTWIQPLAGLIADRRGPRTLNIIGGILAGVGWIATSLIDTPLSLYIAYSIGAIGVGIIYASSIASAGKWFPDKRGLANGVTSFGYGFGAAILNPLIFVLIGSLGFRLTLSYMGIIILIVILILSLVARYPSPNWQPLTRAVNLMGEKGKSLNSEKLELQFSFREMLKTTQLWQIYLAFVLTASTGLMVTSQLTTIGQVFNHHQSTILTATIAFPIANGLGRIIGGFVSDRLGREVTMSLFFLAQGVSTLSILLVGLNEILFIILIVSIGLFWGPIFTFFPSITAEYYGRANLTVNYGVIYTAKAWGGLIGGYLIARLVTLYEGFTMPLLTAAVFCFTSTLLVLPKILRKPSHRIKKST